MKGKAITFAEIIATGFHALHNELPNCRMTDDITTLS